MSEQEWEEHQLQKQHNFKKQCAALTLLDWHPAMIHCGLLQPAFVTADNASCFGLQRCNFLVAHGIQHCGAC